MWPRRPTTWMEGRTLFISIPFTWNLPALRRKLTGAFRHSWERVVVGGPAVELMPDYLADLEHVTIGHHMPGVLQRVNPLATRTTTGCTRSCGFCGIGTGKIEGGGLQLLGDWPCRPIHCDNNILAAPDAHFDRVVERAKWWGWADFNQGLDARLMTDYHARRLKEIGHPMIRLAMDHVGMQDEWENAYILLRVAGIPKSLIRSYALVGFRTDPGEAWKRCQWVENHGIKVLPMWYHALDCLVENSVTEEQETWGWNDYERRRIMQWFYQHKEAVR